MPRRKTLGRDDRQGMPQAKRGNEKHVLVDATKVVRALACVSSLELIPKTEVAHEFTRVAT